MASWANQGSHHPCLQVEQRNQKATIRHQALTCEVRTQRTVDKSASKGTGSLPQSPWTYFRKELAGCMFGVSTSSPHHISISAQRRNRRETYNIKRQSSAIHPAQALHGQGWKISAASMENGSSSFMAAPAHGHCCCHNPLNRGMVKGDQNSQATTRQMCAD